MKKRKLNNVIKNLLENAEKMSKLLMLLWMKNNRLLLELLSELSLNNSKMLWKNKVKKLLCNGLWTILETIFPVMNQQVSFGVALKDH
jgi:hypothetical protein